MNINIQQNIYLENKSTQTQDEFDAALTKDTTITSQNAPWSRLQSKMGLSRELSPEQTVELRGNIETTIQKFSKAITNFENTFNSALASYQANEITIKNKNPRLDKHLIPAMGKREEKEYLLPPQILTQKRTVYTLTPSQPVRSLNEIPTLDSQSRQTRYVFVNPDIQSASLKGYAENLQKHMNALNQLNQKTTFTKADARQLKDIQSKTDFSYRSLIELHLIDNGNATHTADRFGQIKETNNMSVPNDAVSDRARLIT